MKTIKNYIPLTCISALLLATSSCNLVDGLGNDVESNAAYMSNANPAGTVAVLASDDGFTQVVTPRLSFPADKDVEVTIAVDKASLEAFNKANNLALKGVEPEDIILTNVAGVEGKGSVVATIKKGKLSSFVGVRMTSIDPEKYPYSAKLAVALTIQSASGNTAVLSSPKTTIITLNRKIITSAMHMVRPNGGGYSLKFAPDKTYDDLTEWTFQFIVQVNNIHGNNQTTGSLSGSAGFYNRISKTGGLQCKSEGRDGVDTWTNKPINEGEWLHVTYVYRQSGLAGKVTFYVNGELQHTFVTSPLKVEKDAGWGFGNENLRDYYLREVRFWSRALTDAEILDKYYLPEPADSPGLEACFPMTKETYDAETKTFKDITGKWTFELTAKGGAVFEVVDNIVFPAKSLKIEQPATPAENE